MTATPFFKRLFSRKPKPQNKACDAALTERTPLKLSCIISADRAEQVFIDNLFPVTAQDQLSFPQKLVQDVVRHHLTQSLNHSQTTPRLPSVIPRLLRSLRDPNSSAIDYVDIINKDPTMSAAVLKLANSVFFNPTAKPITSIQRAVVGLGIEGMRSVLSAAIMRPVMNQKGQYHAEAGERLWAHSLQVALIAEMLATRHGVEAYKGYLLGLVHDIGKITVFSELNREYALNPGQELPGRPAFAPLLLQLGSKLSGMIAEQWQLPQELLQALQEYASIHDNNANGREVSVFSKILYEANLLGNIIQAEADLPADTLEKVALEMGLSARLIPGIRRLRDTSAI